MPNIAGDGLSCCAPGIEHVNDMFKRVVAGLVNRGVLEIRVVGMKEVLVIGRAPQGSLLVIRIDCWDCRRPHDMGSPFLSVLIGQRGRR